MSLQIEHFTIQSFRFTTGEVLDVSLSYANLNPTAPKKALIPTCYGGRIGDTLNFTEEPASSLREHNVIVVAMMGNGESSSPSNTPNFPKSLDYRDQIHAQHRLMEHLSVKELDVVVGFSMGGQQAYYWAAMLPDFVKHAVAICSSAQTSPHNYAFLEGPIAALSRSSDYADGAYKQQGIKPIKGLQGFGRAYAAWLYSADWFRQGHWKTLTGANTMAEYMNKIEPNWTTADAEDVLILARQWQNGDVGIIGGGYESTLANLKAPVLLMPCRTDQYFPPEDSEIEMRHLKHGQLQVIPSVWGHAAGGGMNPEDTVFMDRHISKFLA